MDDVRRERVQQGRAVDGLRAARLRAVRCGVAVLAAVVAIVASGSLSDVAQSRPGAPAAARAGVPQGPLRAVFYDVAPVPARGLHGRPLPITPARRAAVIARQLAALRWARADAAIVPWSAPSSAGDRRLSAVLRTIAYAHSQVRVAALVTGATGTEADQIHALASKRASAQLYLRIGSRPAVFVAPAAGVPRDCAAAERWRAAASGFWLAQATFAGYERCSSAADAWFVDAPGAGAASAPGTFAIWPGYWPAGAKAPQLRRSVEAWRRSVEQMNASGAPLQLIDSLDGWGDGTAIAPSPRWRSHTRFGRYLDALHAHSPARAPLAQLPTTEAAVLSGVTAHAVSVVATVSPGSLAASWWVEFGPSTGYGQTTVPVPLPAASPPSPATAALTALVAATTYHARVVVASGAGVDVGPDVVFTTLTEPRAMRVAAAGDIACDPALTMTATTCHQVATSNAILAGSYDAVLTLGDQQYNSGSPSQFAGSYQPSWGRFKTITHPVVGNHEYGSPGAAAYFQYFGAAAGEPGKGYYSFDVGPWHMIALNSNCAQVNGCGAGSPQELWLRGDLAAHPVGCTLAYWHHPRFASGQHLNDATYSAIWSDLYAAGAELVLNGHDHDYERFAPQTDAAVRDDARGIREIIVGTGGVNLQPFKAVQPNSEVRNARSFGFLELTLSDSAYAWKFISDTPGGLSDSGSGSCH